jgi:endonuclease G
LGDTVLRGTGFLVAPGVMLTNHHVLMSEVEASAATVTFDYRNDPYGRLKPTTVFSLDPATLFETSAEYDCSFVAVGPRVSGMFQIGDFGWLPLVGAEGKVEVGDPINIVQHPSGEPMQWVVRDNRLLSLPELAGQRDPKVFAHYEADTMPGSSGAPAMSRLWEVFALHHQAIPAVDQAGNPLDLDGNPYFGSDDSRVSWIGNEGIRVSALVRLLEERGTRDGGRASKGSWHRRDPGGLAAGLRRARSGSARDHFWQSSREHSRSIHVGQARVHFAAED